MLCLMAAAALAESTIYRCTAPDGTVEFRQYPCHGRDEAEALDIRDDPTGWVPPQQAPATEDDEKPARSKRAANRNDRDQYAERCWNKRQQIERINNELRAGYSVARGERLKRRRREHEAYLNEFCR
jgi:hypothetical protein